MIPSNVVSDLAAYKDISFAGILVLVLIGGFRLIMFLLKMLKKKEEANVAMSEHIKKLTESNKEMTGFFKELLGRRSNVGGQ